MTASGRCVVRRLRFSYPDDLEMCWTPRRPEFACAANAVSLLLAGIEPFFVRSVSGALGNLDPVGDAELYAETERYVAQEAAHHGQHARFNRLLVNHYRGVGGLDRAVRGTYRRLEQRSSSEFALAFAASSEVMAYSAARWAAEHRNELFDGADDAAASLFLWHLAEEVEHKSVAHDVHRRLHPRGSRSLLVSLAATVIALALVIGFVVAGTTLLLAGERRLHRPVAWARLARWSVLFAFELLTNLALTFTASFHPSQFVDPAWFGLWLAEFDPATATLPYWNHLELELDG